MLLKPKDPAARELLKNRCEFAHGQRNTVAHGVDRELTGFDGTTAGFDTLVSEVDAWGREIILRVLRLLEQVGVMTKLLELRDKAEVEESARTTVVEIVELC